MAILDGEHCLHQLTNQLKHDYTGVNWDMCKNAWTNSKLTSLGSGWFSEIAHIQNVQIVMRIFGLCINPSRMLPQQLIGCHSRPFVRFLFRSFFLSSALFSPASHLSPMLFMLFHFPVPFSHHEFCIVTQFI